MKRKMVFTILVLFSCCSFAGDTLSVFELYEKVQANYPELKNKLLYQLVYQYNEDGINKNWFPSLYLNGQATYQSDVIEFELDIPFDVNIPQMPQDQYKLYLDVQQKIYDGGINKTMLEIEKLKMEANLKNTEITLVQLKLQVNNVYFGILLLQENIKLFKIIKNELNGRLSMVEGAIENGVLLQADRDAVYAEIIGVEQKLIELTEQKNKNITIINYLAGTDYDSTQVFELTTDYTLADGEFNRPELQLFDIKRQQLDAAIQMKKNTTKPMVYAFAQLGYGKPGLNMLSNEFDSYYLAGLGMKWNVVDFGKTNKETNSLKIQQSIIENSKMSFQKNLNIELQQQIAEQMKLEKIIEKDIEMVDLRRKITLATLSKLENGVITSIGYLTEYNKEIQAILNKQKHLIQLENARINFLTIKGLI